MDGLKIIVGADVKPAEQAMKSLVTTADKAGNQAGRALGAGLNKATPAIQKIQQTAKPATLAVSKLGDSLETLRGKLLAKQQFLITEKDITKVAILNREIKLLQSEIIRVQAVGAGGLNFGGAGAAGKKAFSALRTAANILPGVGIAGLLGAGVDFIGNLFSSSDKANDKIKELIVNVKDLASSTAAGTAGEASRVNALVGVITNQTNSYTQRNNALKELQAINKSYFGDLTLEASKLELLKQRAGEYTQAIIQQAIIKAFQDQIGKTAVAISEQTKAFVDAEKKVNAFTEAIKKSEKSGGKTNVLPGFVSNEATGLQKQRKEAVKALLDEGSALSQIRGKYDELQQAINDAVVTSTKYKPLDDPDSGKGKSGIENIIAKAKRIAEFLDKNTQFDVRFEVNPLDSEADTKQKAREFIDKAKKFVETGLPPFDFKPLLRIDFSVIQLKPVNEEIEKLLKANQPKVVKSFETVKKEFEKAIQESAERNPLVIKLAADLKIDPARQSQLADALGLQIEGLNAAKSLLTDTQKKSVAVAGTITSVLTPAFQGMFSAIQAGENPLKSFFQSIGNAVGQLIQKLIAAAIQAAILSALFPGGVGGVKGFGGFFKNIVGFAGGGIVSGPVLAMVGEGRGTSRSNPEVIAPLDQLKGILAGITGKQTMQPVVLRTQVRGNNLQLLSDRTVRRNRRAGG